MEALLQAEVEKFREVVRKGICRRSQPAPEVVVTPVDHGFILMASTSEVIVQYRVLMPDLPKAQLARKQDLPKEPESWTPASREFLDALHEAGRLTSDEHAHYSLNRVQLLGSSGRITASDGKCAYIHRGFHFPFDMDLLVPAVAIFDTAQLRIFDTEVKIGRTETHVVVRIGPWKILLQIDIHGRFPNLSKFIPKASGATELRLGRDDISALLARLKKITAKDHEHVTLKFPASGPAIVSGAKGTQELQLVHSQVTQGPNVVDVNPKHLERGLHLGCRTIRCAGPDRPLVVLGGKVTFLAVCLTTTENPERNNSMKPPERQEQPEDIDPLIEAEALRTALGVAHQRLTRLLVALKSHKKDKKAFTQVLTSLQSLKLR